jgi:manganese efflux pump family protein
LITLFLIALGLSGDTFAVSISSGLTLNKIKFVQALRIAFVLGIFQAVMPVIGWYLGLQIKDFIQDFDHWVAFISLSLIGGKMIIESYKSEDKKKPFNPLNLLVLIGISIATSIDALIVGISFALISVNMSAAFFIIGFTTFFVAMTGVLIGKKTGNKIGKKAEIIGGVILIMIGLRILIQHLMT